ncbi:hypothetical protein GO988_09890 [Hymenobacter sp. HMF4947]|uniref:Uncharacterized protein n=1 Tax=Hymenobacter ginkgonis TaxID=2682976 RepID=A0A7K1TE03_9BACT|nr:hypothetical protein [Hymenobacter ginkgonis]MVN76633.1 hypothetical protein [Hymenobacter ginkgonis]
MKKTFFALLTGCTLLACKKDQPGPALNQTFELPLNQTTTLATGSSPISISLTDVQDSRCPINAYCIWAGYAAVTLKLSDASVVAQTARLSLLNKPSPDYTRDSIAVTLNQQDYWLRLLNVTPYPSTTGGTGQAKTAVLRLRPR